MSKYTRRYTKKTKRSNKRRSSTKRTSKRNGRFRKRGGKRGNIKVANTYTGSEKVWLSAFQTDTPTAENVRFDPISLPRFTSLCENFKHFKLTRCTLSLVPRNCKESWYDVKAYNDGRDIITFENHDGKFSNIPINRATALTRPKARVHTMRTTTSRSFKPSCIKKIQLADSNTNTTVDTVAFWNGWLDTQDANSYLIDRITGGFYAPDLKKVSTDVAFTALYDVYIEVKYKLKGYNYQ